MRQKSVELVCQFRLLTFTIFLEVLSSRAPLIPVVNLTVKDYKIIPCLTNKHNRSDSSFVSNFLTALDERISIQNIYRTSGSRTFVRSTGRFRPRSNTEGCSGLRPSAFRVVSSSDIDKSPHDRKNMSIERLPSSRKASLNFWQNQLEHRIVQSAPESCHPRSAAVPDAQNR